MVLFHVGDYINHHNCNYWALCHNDPNMPVEGLQARLKVFVWCGMTATKVVGPYLLRNTMNTDRYLQMLEYEVWSTVSSWDKMDNVIFIQDGEPHQFPLTGRA